MSSAPQRPLDEIFLQLRTSAQNISLALFHPLKFAKQIEVTDLKSSFIYFLALSCLSGFVFGVCSGEWMSVVVGLIVYPILSWVIGSTLLLGIYYYFYFTEQRTYDWRALVSYFSQVSLLFFFFHPLAGVAARYSMALSGFVDLMSFIFAALIFAYVLVERLKTPKKKTVRLFVSLAALISIIWLVRNVSRWLERSEDPSFRHSRLNQIENHPGTI